jgi:hypothetical protein
MDDEAYLSDTGAEVAKATKTLDEFIRSKRGRHAKEDALIIKQLQQRVTEAIQGIDAEKNSDKLKLNLGESGAQMADCDNPTKVADYVVTDQSFKILSPESLKRALGPSAQHTFMQGSDTSTMVTSSFKVLENEL